MFFNEDQNFTDGVISNIVQSPQYRGAGFNKGDSLNIRQGLRPAFENIATVTSIPTPATLKLSNIGIVNIDFGNSLVTVNSFEVGTEVNFIPSADSSRTTVSYGPYYIRNQFDNNIISLTNDKYQPSIAEYAQFPNKYIQLNQNQYYLGTPVSYDTLNPTITNPTSTQIVFGELPPLQILSTCYWSSSDSAFVLTDTDTTFNLNSTNVTINQTQVRFTIDSTGVVIGDINKATPYVLSTLPSSGNGLQFTVSPTTNLSSIQSYNSATNTIQVMFGLPIETDILNENKGVCVMKLPPSANVSLDSKYDLSDYNGNPCVEFYDDSISVEPIDGYCKFQNRPSGAGSVCQFQRTGTVDGKSQIFDPLPCGTDSSIYEGISYNLECLINNTLTETVRNNPNFLNSSFAGICAYPVHNKFKNCQLYDNNCKVPYVCTGFEGGFFCDSRFDILQCNSVYSCPPTFSCVDGMCLSTPGGYCTVGENCVSGSCGTDMYLSLYNSTLDTDTQVPSGELGNTFNKSNINNKLINLTKIAGLTGEARNYSLVVSSSYNNILITSAFIYDSNNSSNCSLYKIVAPLSANPTATLESITKINIQSQSKFVFDDANQNLYTYFISGTSLSIHQIYPTQQTIPTIPPITVQDSNILKIDIFNGNLLVTSECTSYNGPAFTNLDIKTGSVNQLKNFSVTRVDKFATSSSQKTYILPYFSETLDTLKFCKFDLLNVNDTELDIVCVHNPTDFETPVLGVRHKVREYNIENGYFESLLSTAPTDPPCVPNDPDTNTLGCFLNPTISSLTSITTTTPPTGIPSTTNLYQVTDSADVNTIYAFSNNVITLGGVTVEHIYKSGSSVYLELSGPLTATTNVSVVPTLNDYAPFSFTTNSNLDNYGNVLEKYLEYPYWIDALQDLIVGDNYNPQIQRIFYQPDRVNKNFYAIVNMYTGYADNPIENVLVSTDQNFTNNNTYLFKFSSLNNEIGLIVNETLPIRLYGSTSDPDKPDITRFSQCNQTQNMYFLTNQCS